MPIKKAQKGSPKKRKEKLSNLLRKTRFLPPTTEQEVEDQENTFGHTEIILLKEVDSPDFIFENLI